MPAEKVKKKKETVLYLAVGLVTCVVFLHLVAVYGGESRDH